MRVEAPLHGNVVEVNVIVCMFCISVIPVLAQGSRTPIRSNAGRRSHSPKPSRSTGSDCAAAAAKITSENMKLEIAIETVCRIRSANAAYVPFIY